MSVVSLPWIIKQPALLIRVGHVLRPVAYCSCTVAALPYLPLPHTACGSCCCSCCCCSWLGQATTQPCIFLCNFRQMWMIYLPHECAAARLMRNDYVPQRRAPNEVWGVERAERRARVRSEECRVLIAKYFVLIHNHLNNIHSQC